MPSYQKFLRLTPNCAIQTPHDFTRAFWKLAVPKWLNNYLAGRWVVASNNLCKATTILGNIWQTYLCIKYSYIEYFHEIPILELPVQPLPRRLFQLHAAKSTVLLHAEGMNESSIVFSRENQNKIGVWLNHVPCHRPLLYRRHLGYYCNDSATSPCAERLPPTHSKEPQILQRNT